MRDLRVRNFSALCRTFLFRVATVSCVSRRRGPSRKKDHGWDFSRRGAEIPSGHHGLAPREHKNLNASARRGISILPQHAGQYPHSMPATVSERYAALASEGEIERDPAQEAIALKLTRLEERLAQHRLSRKSSHLGWLFAQSKPSGPIRGAYIHGEVGRGKTMLMDLFFGLSAVKRKRRAHFHEFMADVHERLNAVRHDMKAGRIANDDPIRHVADALAEEAWLLCFDEFHVTNTADAMILGRLFTRLFEQGVVVVATSNVELDALYQDGLHRALFLPFITLLREHMEVVRLEAPKDFRLEKLSGQPIWHVPADEDAEVALDMAWQRLTGMLSGEPSDIAVKGRVIRVPEAAKGVARFSFSQLCEQEIGRAHV